MSDTVEGIWPRHLGSVPRIGLVWGLLDTLILAAPIFLVDLATSIVISTRLIIYISIVVGYSIAEPGLVVKGFLLSRLLAFPLVIFLASTLSPSFNELTVEEQIVFFTVQLFGWFFFGLLLSLLAAFLGNWLVHSLRKLRVSKKTIGVYKIVLLVIVIAILILG